MTFDLKQMIPFVDLKNQYLNHKKAFDEAMANVCAESGFILGSEVETFEKQFADYLGVEEVIGVATGTDALRLSCESLGLGHGDEVLVPANTFIASALAVHMTGAIPVPVDVAADTFLMDIGDAKKYITSRTKAIMPVHLYGRVMNMDHLEELCQAHNLVMIEDACQAHGAEWKEIKAGSFGHAGCFSFYPSKNLGAFGDGGVIATNDRELARKLRRLRNYGSDKKNVHEATGGNSRLDGIQAAVLGIKLPFLDEWNRRRFTVACRYTELLDSVQGVTAPKFSQEKCEQHVFHLYVIRCCDRDALSEFLTQQGVQNGIHYPQPFHLQGAFAHLGHQPGRCPVAESECGEILSLPMFPEISDEQIKSVVEEIRRFYE